MKRPRYILFLFIGLLLWPHLLLKQPRINTELSCVDSLFSEKKFQEAIPVLERSKEIAFQSKQWTNYSFCTTKLAEALYNEWGLATSGTTEKLLDEAIQHLDKAGQGATVPTARIWMWKALNHRRQERFADSYAAYSTAIRILEANHFNGKDLAFCYKNAAQILIRWVNYDQADEYLKAGLLSDSTRSHQLSFISQLTASAYWRGDEAQALHYFETGQAMNSNEESARADLELNGALLFSKMGRLDEARQHALKALAYQNTVPKNGDQRLRCLTALAEISWRSDQIYATDSFYRRAESEGFAYFKGKKSRELAKLYTEWGNALLHFNQNAAALAKYQQALIQAFPTFNNPDPATNPALESVPLESWAMRAAARKAMLLLRAPQPGTAARKNAAECFALTFAIAAELRRVYGTDEAKLDLARYNQDIRQAAMLNLWALYRESPASQKAFLQAMFDQLEDTRAAALRDALQQQRALALSGVPDSLLRQEELLRFQIADANAALQNAQITPDPVSVETAQLKVFQCERRYAELLDALQTTNPQLARYTRQIPQSKPADLLAALPDTTTLLSWFDAGDRYLCLVAQRSGLTAFEVPRDSALDQRLSGFLRRLSDKSAQENAPDAFFAEAWALGNALLPAGALPACKSFIIIPDGRLCYLPFEALLMAPHQGNYGDAPFLLRRYTVHYGWSAVLLAMTQKKASPQNGLLHVAPFVEKARDGLAPLPDSRREEPPMAAVHRLTGPAATVEHFLLRANEYNVLQLSTHAHAGGTSQPGIEFYDRTLALPQIYAQRLPAELVALSACETGAGEYADGEGVLSLARAFAYAGAQSLLASQWAVNERSTAQLFTRFYEHLEGGAPRAEALRQAKLDWLNGPEAEARKAPWHWAAFTLSGADGPVKLPGKGWGAWWWWIALAVAALLVARNLFRAKPSRS